MPKSNKPPERADVTRIKHIMHRLAFAHENMDEKDGVDQAAFAGLWYKFMQFMKPEGMFILVAMSRNWTDAEAGVMCLALVRAMHNKKGPDYIGLKVLGSMAVVSAISCCNEDELRLARSLTEPEDEFEEDEKVSKLEEQLARALPKNRSHLATSDGKVIDLTKVFNPE